MYERYRILPKYLKYFLYLVTGLVFFLGAFILFVLGGVFGKLPDNQSLK